MAEPIRDVKICPYCAEEVRGAAIKCKHCGSMLRGQRFSTSDWYRTEDDKMIAGVCGGLALQFGVPTAIVRLAFVLMTLFMGGVGLVVYVVLWVVMPKDDWLGDPDRELDRYSDDL